MPAGTATEVISKAETSVMAGEMCLSMLKGQQRDRLLPVYSSAVILKIVF